MIHALNYDPDIMKVKPFRVSVRVPGAAGIKASRPATGEVVSHKSGDNGRIEFQMPEFSDHAMVVVSWQ